MLCRALPCAQAIHCMCAAPPHLRPALVALMAGVNRLGWMKEDLPRGSSASSTSWELGRLVRMRSTMEPALHAGSSSAAVRSKQRMHTARLVGQGFPVAGPGLFMLCQPLRGRLGNTIEAEQTCPCRVLSFHLG